MSHPRASGPITVTEVRLYNADTEVTDQYQVTINTNGSFTVHDYRANPPITDYSIDGPAGHDLRHRFTTWWPPDGSSATFGPFAVTT